MTSMNGQDSFWGNTHSNGPTSFDLDRDVASSHPQSQSLQQHGSPITYSYPGGKIHQIAGGSDAAPYAPIPSGSVPLDHSRRGRQLQQLETVPQGSTVPPQINTAGLAQDYNHLGSRWSPPTGDTPVNTGRSPRSGSHSQQARSEYNQTSPIQPTYVNGRQHRSPSQHYEPSTPATHALEDTRMSVDTSSSHQRCIIPGCQYPAYYNVAEEELMEYCGHGHELQAIETGFVKPCAMCKGRPRRTGERVCGPVCRERERHAHTVQGTYYGVQVTRREPQTRR